MAMLSLRKIAEAESGWLDVIQSMIEGIENMDRYTKDIKLMDKDLFHK